MEPPPPPKRPLLKPSSRRGRPPLTRAPGAAQGPRFEQAQGPPPSPHPEQEQEPPAGPSQEPEPMEEPVPGPSSRPAPEQVQEPAPGPSSRRKRRHSRESEFDFPILLGSQLGHIKIRTVEEILGLPPAPEPVRPVLDPDRQVGLEIMPGIVIRGPAYLIETFLEVMPEGTVVELPPQPAEEPESEPALTFEISPRPVVDPERGLSTWPDPGLVQGPEARAARPGRRVALASLLQLAHNLALEVAVEPEQPSRPDPGASPEPVPGPSRGVIVLAPSPPLKAAQGQAPRPALEPESESSSSPALEPELELEPGQLSKAAQNLPLSTLLEPAQALAQGSLPGPSLEPQPGPDPGVPPEPHSPPETEFKSAVALASLLGLAHGVAIAVARGSRKRKSKSPRSLSKSLPGLTLEPIAGPSSAFPPKVATPEPDPEAELRHILDTKFLAPVWAEHDADILHLIANFEVFNSDTFVMGYPRTGTTWMQEMVWLIANNLDYHGATDSMLDERFPTLEYFTLCSRAPDLLSNSLACHSRSLFYINRKDSPRFIRTHLPPSQLPKEILKGSRKPKIIYVLRDPKDVCVSWYRFWFDILPLYHGTLNDFGKLFMAGRLGPGPFWDHAKWFWERKDRQNMLFIMYEDMILNLRGVVERVAAFLGKTVSEEQMGPLLTWLSFESMVNNPTINRQYLFGKHGFLRTGQMHYYDVHMSPDMIWDFTHWTQTQLEGHELRNYYM